MKQLQIDDMANYIERANYGPVEMTPSFSTKKEKPYTTRTTNTTASQL